MKNNKVCNKTKSPPSSLLFKGQGTEQWPIIFGQIKSYINCRIFYIGATHIVSTLILRKRMSGKKF